MTRHPPDPLPPLLASLTDPELAGAVRFLKGAACNMWPGGLLRCYRRAA